MLSGCYLESGKCYKSHLRDKSITMKNLHCTGCDYLVTGHLIHIAPTALAQVSVVFMLPCSAQPFKAVWVYVATL